ncbi:MAG: tetratricopeptide repeat protein [Nitrospinota bacterium]|nr:tetratricopeptide repeat protein [Nitrospinota bacterium]
MKTKLANWRKTQGYLDQLISLYGKMMVGKPRSFIFLPLADSCIKAGRLRLANEVINRGLSHHAGLTSGLLMKARIMMAQGKHEAAEKMISPIIEKSPDNFLARKLMAETCLKLNKPGIGIQHLEHVRKAACGTGIREDLFRMLEDASRKRNTPAEETGGNSKQNIVNTLERWLTNAGKMMIRE